MYIMCMISFNPLNDPSKMWLLLLPHFTHEKNGSTEKLRSFIRVAEGFPGGSVVKNPPANAGDAGLIPGLGRFPGEGNRSLLQCSCLRNPLDRGAWQATIHGFTKSQT